MTSLSMTDLTNIFLSLGAMLAMARILGEVARRYNQPSVIGEIGAGIILGPTFAGRFFPGLVWFLRPSPETHVFMSGFTSVAVVLFLLVAGMEVDLAKVFRQGRTALLVSASGILFPFVLGFCAVLLLPHFLGQGHLASRNIYALFFATALSISALPVIAKTLMDLNFYRTDIGMIIIASAILDDLGGWMIFSIILGTIGVSSGSGLAAPWVILIVILFTGGMLTVGRWAVHNSLPWVLAHTSWPGGVLAFAVSIALAGASFTEWIGIHAVFGSFMVGVALGDSEHMRKRTKETLDQFVSFIFAPLFFASIGLGIDFIRNFDPALTLFVILIAFAGKVAGCGLGAWLGSLPRREALAVGFGMNARGGMGIILALLGIQYGIIGEKMFVSLVLMALATSMTSGPVMQVILKSQRKRQVGDYLLSRAFINPLKARDVQGVIAELAGIIASASGAKAKEIEQAVLVREQIVPTGIGFEAAIPHARIEGLSAPVIGVGISKEGVDFNATDGKPAKLVFLILTPQNDLTAQVEILSEISRLLKNGELCERLKRASSFTEFLGLFRTKEV